MKVILDNGAQIHPQYRTEFENGVSVGWHRLPWALGCEPSWTEEKRQRYYEDLCAFDGRIVLAGGHVGGIWQEHAIFSGLDAIKRLHQRVMAGSGQSMIPRIISSFVAAVLVCTGSSTVVAQSSGGAALTYQGGEVLFNNVCQSCHMPEGHGAGPYPALIKDAKLNVAGYPITLIMNGSNNTIARLWPDVDRSANCGCR